MPASPSVFGSAAMSTRLLRVSSLLYTQAQVVPADVVRGVPSSTPSVERCEAERTEQASAFSFAGSSGLDTFGAPLPPPLPGALLAVSGALDAAGLAVPVVVVLQPAMASAASARPGRTSRRF